MERELRCYCTVSSLSEEVSFREERYIDTAQPLLPSFFNILFMKVTHEIAAYTATVNLFFYLKWSMGPELMLSLRIGEPDG